MTAAPGQDRLDRRVLRMGGAPAEAIIGFTVGGGVGGGPPVAAVGRTGLIGRRGGRESWARKRTGMHRPDNRRRRGGSHSCRRKDILRDRLGPARRRDRDRAGTRAERAEAVVTTSGVGGGVSSREGQRLDRRRRDDPGGPRRNRGGRLATIRVVGRTAWRGVGGDRVRIEALDGAEFGGPRPLRPSAPTTAVAAGARQLAGPCWRNDDSWTSGVVAATGVGSRWRRYGGQEWRAASTASHSGGVVRAKPARTSASTGARRNRRDRNR